MNWKEAQTVDYSSFLRIADPLEKTRIHYELNASVNAKGNETYSTKFKIIRPSDHSQRWLHLQDKTTLKTSQQTSRFIGTVLDITETVLAEEKNARLLAIIESSNDAIISITLDEIITSWNNTAEEIFGYRQDEMLSTSAHHIIPADKQQELSSLLSRVAQGERVDVAITAVAAYLQMVLQKAQKDQDSFYVNMISRADIKIKNFNRVFQENVLLCVLRAKIPRYQIWAFLPATHYD